MKIKVDFDLCESNAMCEALAPDVFELDDHRFDRRLELKIGMLVVLLAWLALLANLGAVAVPPRRWPQPGKASPNRSWQRAAVASCAGVRSTPTGRAPCLASRADR